MKEQNNSKWGYRNYQWKDSEKGDTCGENRLGVNAITTFTEKKGREMLN